MSRDQTTSERLRNLERELQSDVEECDVLAREAFAEDHVELGKAASKSGRY